jgi:hypothetical protein
MSDSTYSETQNISLPAAEAITPFLAVTVNSAGRVAKADTSDFPVGITRDLCQAAAVDDPTPIHILGKGGTFKAVQAGAIALGAPVYLADDGTVQAAPASPTAGATYRRIGVKIGPDEGAAGDVIEIIDMGVQDVILNPASITGAELSATGLLTPIYVTGADASSAAQDLTATGITADMRIAFVLDITDSAVLDSSIFTPGADKITQASGNYATDKILVVLLPAAA